MKVPQRDPRAARAFGAVGRHTGRQFTVSAIVERIDRPYAIVIADSGR